MQMKTILNLIVILYSIIFPFIFVFYTIPKQILLGGTYYPKVLKDGINSWVALYPRLLLAFLGYSFVALILLLLIINVLRAYSVANPIKKETLKYLLGYYIYGFLASGFVAVGLIVFITLKKSFDTSVVWGLAYPILLAIAQLFSGIAAYFLLVFSVYMERRGYPRLLATIELFLLLIFGVLSSLPNNFYGMDVPRGVPYLRFLSAGALFVVYALALYPSAGLLQRARLEMNYSLKVRLYLLVLGNVSLVLFFVGYALDAISGIAYSMWIIISLAFLSIAAILYYLSISPPDWFLRKLEKNQAK